MSGGGTSLEAPRSRTWLVALVLVAPAGAYIVHRLGGDGCGWSYGAMGGACRSVILLSLLAGGAAGALAAVATHRASQERSWSLHALGAIGVVVLAILSAREFADYGGVGTRMTDAQCRFARQTLPDCVETVWGHDDAETVRKAQPGCYGDARSLRTYDQCAKLTDCKQIVDCVAHGH